MLMDDQAASCAPSSGSRPIMGPSAGFQDAHQRLVGFLESAPGATLLRPLQLSRISTATPTTSARRSVQATRTVRVVQRRELNR